MNLHRALITDLADALIAQGLEVEGYYPESGPGQQEVNIRYAEAMQAADRQIVYRETARGEATRHGLIASLNIKPRMPLPIPTLLWVPSSLQDSTALAAAWNFPGRLPSIMP